jgi:hypothetical protein
MYVVKSGSLQILAATMFTKPFQQAASSVRWLCWTGA